MILYCDSDGLKLYTEYQKQEDGKGSVPVGTLVLSPGFNELTDEKYEKYRHYLDNDPKVSLNAEKRKYGFSSLIFDGWYCEPPCKEGAALAIWGKDKIPEGHALIDQVLCLKMADGAGSVTRLHCVIYHGFDNITRLAIGGKIVATGIQTGVTGMSRAWKLAGTGKEWIDLCQKFPIPAK